MIRTKTSITLDTNILKEIDDFRRKQPYIPTRSFAIVALIKRGLKAYNWQTTQLETRKAHATKEPNHTIPQDTQPLKKK